MASIHRLQERIAGMVFGGASLNRVEDEVMPGQAGPGSLGAPGGRIERTLPHHAGAALLAREAVEELQPALPPLLQENTKLVVSELVTNAVRHGRGGVALSLALTENGRPTGEVVDEGDSLEAPREQPADDDHGGWGLFIVDALAERWGVSGASSRIWFEMPAGPAPTA